MEDEVLKSVICSELNAIKQAAIYLKADLLTESQLELVGEIIDSADFIGKELKGE